MKPFKEVDATRREYHANSTKNSVHRSSLMVPEIKGSVAEISFLNHFLIKRSYAKVVCRITGIDLQGKRVESRAFLIEEPRVYVYRLSGSFEVPVSGYVVEFFASDNLFIPFPAVIVNHWNADFINSVHSYNRVLNDVFEDDAVNSISVKEASIDIRVSDMQPFFVFSTGPQAYTGFLDFELSNGKEIQQAQLKIDLPRLTPYEILLSDVFPNLQKGFVGGLKIKQPTQFLFYGRMLAGHRYQDGAFSANHSYYDCSEASEYWDNAAPSSRLYPFFVDFENKIRIYPIMAPGVLDFSIEFFDHAGGRIATVAIGQLESPGMKFLDIELDELCCQEGIERGKVAAFNLQACPVTGHTPTRINHQFIQSKGKLESSINTSLFNPNVFVPEGKKGYTWGQLCVGGPFESWLGIVANCDEVVKPYEFTLTFYTEKGQCAERKYTLLANSSKVLKFPDEILHELGALPEQQPTYVWFTLKGGPANVAAYVVTKHKETNHCTGEHSF